MQEELHFDRYYLLYQPDFRALCRRVEEDIRTCSPDTEVIAEAIAFRDPWDFGEVYSKLYDFSREKNFSAEEHDYYIHITTGTHVAQICLFLLNESHHLPGKLIQTQPTLAELRARLVHGHRSRSLPLRPAGAALCRRTGQ